MHNWDPRCTCDLWKVFLSRWMVSANVGACVIFYESVLWCDESIWKKERKIIKIMPEKPIAIFKNLTKTCPLFFISSNWFKCSLSTGSCKKVREWELSRLPWRDFRDQSPELPIKSSRWNILIDSGWSLYLIFFIWVVSKDISHDVIFALNSRMQNGL